MSNDAEKLAPQIANDLEKADRNNEKLPPMFEENKIASQEKVRRLSQMTMPSNLGSPSASLHGSIKGLKSPTGSKDSRYLKNGNKKQSNKFELFAGQNDELSSDDDEIDPLMENEVEEEDKTTFWGMTANLTLAGLGTGILSMPQCMASAGVFNAVVWIAIGLALNYITNYTIIVAGDKHQVFELEDLMALMPHGKWVKRLAIFGTWLMMFLAFSGYIAGFKDFSLKAADHIFDLDLVPNSDAEMTWKRLLMVLAACLVIPLCFLKQSQLSKTSTISICINLYMMVVVFINFFLEYNQPENPQSSTDKEFLWQQKGNVCFFSTVVDGNLANYSAIMMAAVIQPCVLPMYKTLEDRSPQKFANCMKASYIFLTCIFSLFGLMAYMTYGPNVDGNVTNSLKMSKVQNLILLFGMSFVVLTVYPILLIPMVSPIKSKFTKTVVTVCIVLATLGFALFGPDNLMFFNIMCGVVSGLFFIGLIPSIIGWYFLADKPEDRRSFNSKNMKWLAILIVGLSGTVFGLIYSDPITGIRNNFKGYVVETTKLQNGYTSTKPLFEVSDFDTIDDTVKDFHDMTVLRRTEKKEGHKAEISQLEKASGLSEKRILELRALHTANPQYFDAYITDVPANSARYSIVYDGYQRYDEGRSLDDAKYYCKLSLNGGTAAFSSTHGKQPTQPKIEL